MTKITLNRDVFEALVKLRGWDHPVVTLAKKTGFTKGYISQVLHGSRVTADFMAALIEVAGSDPRDHKEWGKLFSVVKVKDVPGPQRNNYLKFTGQKPYVEFSPERRLRQQEKASELERLKAEVPIPASDYYDDAMPSRYQASHRYKR